MDFIFQIWHCLSSNVVPLNLAVFICKCKLPKRIRANNDLFW